MNKRSKGKIYEEKGKEYLENIGVKVLAMNYQGSFGEIDIIGYDETTLVFLKLNIEKTYLLECHKRR